MWLLDWIPVRLTALSFAIVGDFEDAAGRQRQAGADRASMEEVRKDPLVSSLSFEVARPSHVSNAAFSSGASAVPAGTYSPTRSSGRTTWASVPTLHSASKPGSRMSKPISAKNME